jgi:hypothetical protein
VFVKIPAKVKPGTVTVSQIAITISTTNTVIWYDEWEDGYDLDVAVSTAKTTQIWGDGDATNGCAPNVKPCTNLADVLTAGMSFLLESNVVLPRSSAQFFYDGGDRMQSSFPISISRVSYPLLIGPILGGAGKKVTVTVVLQRTRLDDLTNAVLYVHVPLSIVQSKLPTSPNGE